MNEQKYYVKLKPSISVIVEHDDQDNEIEFGYGYLNGLHEFSPFTTGNTFTKSELAEIMDGALYTQTLFKDCIPPDHVYYGSGEKIVSEWINPLIELVPVEDDE